VVNYVVSYAVREVRERVGVAILRKIANIIINAIKGVPHPALLEARRHLHTAYRPVEGQWQKVGDDCQPDDGPPVWGEVGSSRYRRWRMRGYIFTLKAESCWKSWGRAGSRRGAYGRRQLDGL